MNVTGLTSALVAGLLAASLALLIISVLAYRRTRRRRFLVVASAFVILLTRQVALAVGLFGGYAWESLFLLASAADAVLLLVLYVAVVR